jgi:ElaB/YqjD/DUF883 family membrane-anchored ribosome-binding protein
MSDIGGGMKSSSSDVDQLKTELRNLRDDFSRIADIVTDSARSRGAEAAGRIRETAERGWSDAKTTAQSVLEELEERPIGTAMIVFVAGMLFGLMVGGGRR